MKERLRQAMGYKFNSVAEFQRAAEAAGVHGSSEPAIYRYLRGVSTPSLAFIEAVAPMLGVTPEWLAFGVGQPADSIPDEIDIRTDVLRRIVREEIERASVVLTTHTR